MTIINDKSIGEQLLYKLHKENFDKVSSLILQKLNEKEEELNQYILKQLNYINSDEFTQFKNDIFKVQQLKWQLESSSIKLFDINYSNMQDVLGWKKANELIESINNIEKVDDGKSADRLFELIKKGFEERGYKF